jgi:NAD-dependent deacetylase
MSAIERAKGAIAAAERVVTFSGAGLSAESGIPTFREASTGLWAKYDPTELASPEGFAANPELVIDWYRARRKTLAGSVPNSAHLAMAERPDMTHLTQNVDNLLEAAGAEEVIHLHGRIDQDRCHRSCGFIESVNLADPPGLRRCPRCGARVRPAVVWYGEPLPDAVWTAAVNAVEEADVLIVVGTSGVVFPAAGLIDQARNRGARIIVVNAEPISSVVDITIIGSAGSIMPELLAG